VSYEDKLKELNDFISNQNHEAAIDEFTLAEPFKDAPKSCVIPKPEVKPFMSRNTESSIFEDRPAQYYIN
jgi:hypothetical protein